MFSGKDAANPSYPTQWALNPNAYQNMDASQVDWAALAQQWIAMKDATTIISASAPPSKLEAEEGEAPMEVENIDSVNTDSNDTSSGDQWRAQGNSWGNSWNQWNSWGWPGPGGDPKAVDPASVPIPQLMENFNATPEVPPTMPGYTTAAPQGPTFQHGYWTAPQVDNTATNNRNNSNRSKSKNRDTKSSNRPHRPIRDKPPLMPPLIEQAIVPGIPMSMTTLDAAKRRQLPAWIREGLEKMEREKQRAIEKEQEKKAREEAEAEKKRLEEEELERLRAAAGGQPIAPPKSKFESESEGEESDKELEEDKPPKGVLKKEQSPDGEDTRRERELSPIAKKSKDEIMQEVMLAVRRSLTEILLEVTDQEIHSVSQEELARYTALQASHLNAVKASKSKALASIASGLGLGAYESSSDESDAEQKDDLNDQQLQEIIRRKKLEFERTARDFEDDERRAAPGSTTPPPPPAPPAARARRGSHRPGGRGDGGGDAATDRPEPVPEDKPTKSSKRDRTPTPPRKRDRKRNDSTSTSDSEQDSSDSSSSNSESEQEKKVERKAKKRKHRSSSDSDSHRKSRKSKKEKSQKSSSRRYDDYEREKSRSRRDDYYEKSHKSSRSREYERSHKDRYRDSSDERRRSRRDRHRR